MNEAFAEIPQEEWAESISNEEYFIGKLEEKGVTVSELSDSDCKSINEAFMTYWKTTANKIGGNSFEMLYKILALSSL